MLIKLFKKSADQSKFNMVVEGKDTVQSFSSTSYEDIKAQLLSYSATVYNCFNKNFSKVEAEGTFIAVAFAKGAAFAHVNTAWTIATLTVRNGNSYETKTFSIAASTKISHMFEVDFSSAEYKADENTDVNLMSDAEQLAFYKAANARMAQELVAKDNEIARLNEKVKIAEDIAEKRAINARKRQARLKLIYAMCAHDVSPVKVARIAKDLDIMHGISVEQLSEEFTDEAEVETVATQSSVETSTTQTQEIPENYAPVNLTDIEKMLGIEIDLELDLEELQ